MSAVLIARAITKATHVTYPQGLLKGVSSVLDAVCVSDSKIALILECTPFHPVDPRWPDQPADKGTLTIETRQFNVIHCFIYMVNKTTHEMKDRKAVARTESDQYIGVVGHIIDPAELAPDSFIGKEATVEVDEAYRTALNTHHTACHLAALALNLETACFWSKTAKRTDSLGSANLDQIAIESSSISHDQAEDFYRFGKSIRKDGFNTEEFFSNIEAVTARINERLRVWLTTAADITITVEGPEVDARRDWHCTLPEGKASLPCGGTHLTSLATLANITYLLTDKTDTAAAAGAGTAAPTERRLQAITKAVLKS